MTTVSKNASDPFVPEARWIASLSNGETIYQDDNPELDKSWNRLGKYCNENSLNITQMRWQHKHLEHVSKPNADAYAMMGRMRCYGTQASTITFCGIGYLQDDQFQFMFLSEKGHSFRDVKSIDSFIEDSQIIYNGK